MGGDGRLVTSFPGSFLVALLMHIVKKGAVVYPWYTLDTGTFRHTLRSKILSPSMTCSRVQWLLQRSFQTQSWKMRPDDILSWIRSSWGLLFRPGGCFSSLSIVFHCVAVAALIFCCCFHCWCYIVVYSIHVPFQAMKWLIHDEGIIFHSSL